MTARELQEQQRQTFPTNVKEIWLNRETETRKHQALNNGTDSILF